MSYVQRLNPSLRGLGCSCDDASFGQSGMSGLADLIAAQFPIPMNPIRAAGMGYVPYTPYIARPSFQYPRYTPYMARPSLMGLGMDTYSVMSWHPPSQSSQGGYFGNGGGDMSVNTPGTAAHGLAAATPDQPTPIGTAVVDAFSNNSGGAQPGVLPLYPNATADGLSFVKTPPPSLQCQLVNSINSNPVIFLGAVFGVVYLANMGSHKVREYRAKRKAAKT